MVRSAGTNSLVAQPTWRDAAEGEHFAQVYESDALLVTTAADFAGAALRSGAAAVVIATSTHLDDIAQALANSGLTVQELRDSGQLVLLDADETLVRLLSDGVLQRRQFFDVIGSIIDAATRRFKRVVAFGEMVNVLWRDGQLDTALALEDLWNELVAQKHFTLYCAYHLRECAVEQRSRPFEDACDRHARVLHAESHAHLHTGTPQRVIARLQHRAYLAENDQYFLESKDDHLAHFAAIVASSDDAIVSKTLDSIIQSWNAGAERIFGYSAEEIVGKSITIIIPPELVAEEKQILEKLRRGERIEHFETVRMGKHGNRVPVSLTVSPVRNARGDIIGASKIARDISERHAAERAIAEAQKLLALEARAMLVLNEWSSRLWRCRSLDEGLELILDAVIGLLGAEKGLIQLRDGSAMHVFAQRGFERDFLDLFKSVTMADECACGRAMRTGSHVVVEDVETDPGFESFRGIAAKAGFRAAISTPFVAGDGMVVGVVSVQFPQPHRPTETELRSMQLYARQATDFIQRCAAEEILQRSEQALREADRRKDEFLAILAHEIRNPLAPLRTGLQVLGMMKNEPAITEKTLAMMHRQMNQIIRLVDDLMDVSRIGRGKIELRNVSVDLVQVLGNAIDASRPTIDAARHQLQFDAPVEPILLEGDEVRLSQVFTNLLNNAAKYTEPGGRINVRVEPAETSVAVHVSDSGIGIPEHMLLSVFGIFSQVDQSLEKAQGGLGIGLALVKGLVELHGGTVTAMSDGPGHGSTFVVRLPRPHSAAGRNV